MKQLRHKRPYGGTVTCGFSTACYFIALTPEPEPTRWSAFAALSKAKMTQGMKIKNRFGASPLSFIMMMAVACVTFSQVLPASAQTGWQLNGKFQDGGTATGTFDLNAAGNTITAWNIQVTKDVNNPAYSAYTYSNTTSGSYQFTLGSIYGVFNRSDLSSLRGLDLVFPTRLTSSVKSENL